VTDAERIAQLEAVVSVLMETLDKVIDQLTIHMEADDLMRQQLALHRNYIRRIAKHTDAPLHPSLAESLAAGDDEYVGLHLKHLDVSNAQ